MAKKIARKPITLEDLQNLQLPVVGVEGRRELVVGITQTPDLYRSVKTVERDNKRERIILRRYDFQPFTGQMGLACSDDTISPHGQRFDKEGVKKYNFYDAKLRKEGL